MDGEHSFSFSFWGLSPGLAQSLDQYGWAFHVPPGFSGYYSVAGHDGAIYSAGVASDFEFRGVKYSALGGEDVFVIKILPSGALGWVERFGGIGNDSVTSLSINESGQLVVAGFDERVGNRQWIVDTSGQLLGTQDWNHNGTLVALADGGGFVEITNSGFRVVDTQGKFLRSFDVGPNIRLCAVRELPDKSFLMIGTPASGSGESSQVWWAAGAERTRV